MNKNSKIYIAGHTGMVGSALVRLLSKEGYSNLVMRSSKDLDLRCQSSVNAFFQSEKPEYVFMAAAKVGGILANNVFRAEFIYDNLMIEANIINAAYQFSVKKLLFLGSSCIYPKLAPQPLKENYLLTGALEPTNEPYAIAKIAGIKLCEAYWDQYGSNFISAMPTNLYGKGDNYDLQSSHVVAAMINKFHTAKINREENVIVWGTGEPLREFMYVDDLADACCFLMKNYNDRLFINVGSEEEISIKNLAVLIKQIVEYKGEILFDNSKPDGTPRKLMDGKRLTNLGWTAKTKLKDGLSKTYEFYKSELPKNQ